ncbi:MAG TPA: hypothetical protein VEJ67_17125 [Candidatus Cybelea sp.]|nr:hypothetical protein [Candidatus Cybelea sp.]
MTRKLLSLVSAAILGGITFVSANAAQSDSSKSSPLKVAAQILPDAGCRSGSAINAQLDYTGAQPLRGYLVVLAVADGVTAEPLGTKIMEETRDSREPITSGAGWTRSTCATEKMVTGDPARVTAWVDVLKFSSGSIWGPHDRRESSLLIGAIDGMDFSVKNSDLKRFVSPILPERGPFPAESIQTKTIGPLRIESGVWRDRRGKEWLAADVTNDSETPVRGFLLKVSFFDPATGERIHRVSTKELDTSGDPSGYLAPGQTWIADPRKFSHLADGSLAAYEIGVDLVVFADGSTFGPKQSSESDEVLGMICGIDLANRSGDLSPDREER